MNNLPNLTGKQHWLLCEALRRYSKFSDYKDIALTSAWTGLGSATQYKPALDKDLMTYATTPNPGFMTWFKLTPLGAQYVQAWLDQGYTYEDAESGRLEVETWAQQFPRKEHA
jgi:hypothetical protein